MDQLADVYCASALEASSLAELMASVDWSGQSRVAELIPSIPRLFQVGVLTHAPAVGLVPLVGLLYSRLLRDALSSLLNMCIRYFACRWIVHSVLSQ